MAFFCSRQRIRAKKTRNQVAAGQSGTYPCKDSERNTTQRLMVQAAPDAERCAHHKESNEASPWLRITFRENSSNEANGPISTQHRDRKYRDREATSSPSVS